MHGAGRRPQPQKWGFEKPVISAAYARGGLSGQSQPHAPPGCMAPLQGTVPCPARAVTVLCLCCDCAVAVTVP